MPLGLILSLIAAATGCSHARYSAATLPNRYVAPPHLSVHQIDLGRLPRNAVPAEWLQPGDAVKVAIATGVENDEVPAWELRLDPQGRADIPLVGAIPVAGLSPNLAAERIRDEATRRGVYVDPKVTVSIVQKRTNRVSVVGAVNEPNTYELPASSSDLLTAITMAKGLADDADTLIEIRHSAETLSAVANSPQTVGPNGVALASHQQVASDPVVHVDLEKAEDLSPRDLRLLDGSVVHVARQPERIVNVLGLVNKPGAVEMPQDNDLRLLAAIAQAGGTTLSVADHVTIVRNLPDSPQPVVIEASLSDARAGGKSDMRLAPGDVVNVDETPATYTIQAIRSFFRVGFSAALPGL